MDNIPRTKHAHTGEIEPDYTFPSERGKKFQILHKESMWSDKYNCWQKQFNQPFFLRCLCDF